MGDVVNAANRLQGLAEPGTILVDPKTAALLGDGFRTTPGSAVPVKGRAAPVQATLIEGLAD